MTTASVTPLTDPAGRRPAQDEAYAVVTVLLLLLGGFVVPVVGWLAGAVMLWAGPRWNTRAKILGTLAWPAVLALPALALAGFAAATHDGAWTFGGTAVVGVVAAAGLLPWAFVHLLRAARR